MIPYTITAESVVVILNGETYTVKAGDPKYKQVRDAVLNEQWDAIKPLMSVGFAIQKWARGFFTFAGGEMLYKGKSIPDGLCKRMVAMAEAEGDPRVLMKFYERCMANPDPRSIEQLWPFLEHNGIPLTKDGCFLAYKAVRPDLKDAHSRTMTYSVGKYISMPREDVQNDPNIACAPGLHVGAKEYVDKHYQDDSHVMLVVKVDPADVVSVPYDYYAMKLRACGMLVLGYYGSELPDLVWGDEDIGADALDAVNDHIAKSKVTTLRRNPEENVLPAWEDDGNFEDEDEDTDEDDHYFEDEDEGEDDIDGERDDDTDDDWDDEAEDEEEAAALVWLQDELEAPAPLTDTVRVFTPEEDMAYSTVDATDEAGLSKLPIDLLRKYASAWLSIVGASKIPGGKPALIAKIMKVRGIKTE